MTSIDEVFNPKLTRKEFLDVLGPVLDALKQHEARLNALEKKEKTTV